jgi:single-stranded-DNA-specific exonuclease
MPKISSTIFSSINLQLKLAVKLIKQAIADKQNILIYGDYDVDGITATAILGKLFIKLIQTYSFYSSSGNDVWF